MKDIKGHLVLLMAPSGSGKRTLVEGLGELSDKLYFAKTYTSRQPREGVTENPKYVFISREEFDKMVAADEFIEWANFSGNLYGTPIVEFEEPLMRGEVVFKEMELQGIGQIKKIFPADKISIIYIDSGNWDDLKERIIARAPISEEELQLRHERFLVESAAKGIATDIVSNENGRLQEAQQEFRELVEKIVSRVSL